MQIFYKMGVFKIHKIQRKTPLLELLFNKVAGLKARNFIKKRLQYRYFHVNFCAFFQNTLFIEHLRMTAPADSSVPTKVFFIHWPHFFRFSLIFYPFIVDNCNGTFTRKDIKIKIFLKLIYPRINMNVVKTTSP